MATYDVVVVGASIAGSTAATILGRAGVRVALVERHRSADAFKVLCTHHVMACATPTTRRLGADRAIEAMGGVRNGLDAYTPWGWIVSPEDRAFPHGYSIRRRKLDPLLRALAGETPGVDLLLGQSAVGLVDARGRVAGVRLRDNDGRERVVRARLVVGADGARSTVAELADSARRTAPNGRFIFFAEYVGVELASGTHTQIWMHEPDIAYAMPNDDDVTVLACMPRKERLAEFRSDRVASMVEFLRGLPDHPEFDPAARVSKVIGTTDYPMIARRAVPRPGVALIGDAALTSDPAQGVGCGWAFQSAEWLADAVAPALLDGAPLQPALRRYMRRRRRLESHQSTIEKEARLEPPTALDRLMLRVAVHDPLTAAHVLGFFNRTMSPWQYLDSRAVGRAVRIDVGHRTWSHLRPGRAGAEGPGAR